MLKIDNSLLQEIGLGGLPDAEKNSFLKHIYETLEMRVGIRLADQMSNEQLDEFEKYFEAKDDAGAFKWLETNFPNYKEIVQQEFDKLKAEVAQSAPQILAASQAQAAANPQPTQQAPAPPQQPQQPAQPQYQPPAPAPQPQYDSAAGAAPVPPPQPAPAPTSPSPQPPQQPQTFTPPPAPAQYQTPAPSQQQPPAGPTQQ